MVGRYYLYITRNNILKLNFKRYIHILITSETIKIHHKIAIQ